MDAVTGYLSIDRATLKTELAAGKSLAQIATERGKSREGLKAAIAARLPAGADTPLLDRILDEPLPRQRIER